MACGGMESLPLRESPQHKSLEPGPPLQDSETPPKEAKLISSPSNATLGRVTAIAAYPSVVSSTSRVLTVNSVDNLGSF